MAVKAFSRTMCPRRSLNNEEELAWREVVLFASEESAEKLELGRRSKLKLLSASVRSSGAVQTTYTIQWTSDDDHLCLSSCPRSDKSPIHAILRNLKFGMNKEDRRFIAAWFWLSSSQSYVNAGTSFAKKVPAPVLQTYSERAHLCCPSSKLFTLGCLVHCSAHGLALE